MLGHPKTHRPLTTGPGTAVQPCAAQPGHWLCLPRADVSLNFAADISSIGMSDINRELPEFSSGTSSFHTFQQYKSSPFITERQ